MQLPFPSLFAFDRSFCPHASECLEKLGEQLVVGIQVDRQSSNCLHLLHQLVVKILYQIVFRQHHLEV